MIPITGQTITSTTTDLIPKVLADAASETTSILPANMCITGLLLLILKIFVYGLGAAAIIGITIAGIQYMTARDNQAQVTAAKKRLFDVTIGMAAWAIMWAVMNWLIPGGMVDLTQGYDEVCPNVALNLPNKVDPSQTDHGSAFGNGSSGGSSSSGGTSGGSSSGGNSSSSDGVTRVKYEGKLYAFPLKNATHENLLAIGNEHNASYANGWGHAKETGWAMDLMLYRYSFDSYFSTGVIPWIEPVYVVAMTSGELVWKGTNGYPSDCISLRIKDDSGGAVEYIHMQGDPELQVLHRRFETGDVLGRVGAQHCTGNTSAPHLHIQFVNAGASKSEFRLDSKKLRKVMDLLWGAMPAQ